jgi:sugar (pentulose or hexulose) kinase
MLTSFVLNTFGEVLADKRYKVRGVNFSAYGASLVYLNIHDQVLTPLYNYLKPYPQALLDNFYNRYGGQINFSRSAASPVLGSLNSGMQIFRLKHEQPEKMKSLAYVLHLPQYLASLVSGQYYSELTSIGCHTNLWDFDKNAYQQWLKDEQLNQYLPPLADKVHTSVQINGGELIVGTGLHDSSAALIPYLLEKKNRFLLLSTGTWCISINPFNNSPLSQEELQNDCLCFLQPNGKAVKAARFFGGQIHQENVTKIATKFNISIDEILQISYDDEEITLLMKLTNAQKYLDCIDVKISYFVMMHQLIVNQKNSTDWVLQHAEVDEIVVDGGFARNRLFMKLLQLAYPDKLVTASELSQGSSLGAAIVLKEAIWNS